MRLVQPKDVSTFKDSAQVLGASLVVVHCLQRSRNEWVNWSGDTDNVYRPIGWAYPNNDLAAAAAETNRAPGTVLAVRDTVGIELTCDKGLAIAYHRFTDGPFTGVTPLLQNIQNLNKLKAILNAFSRIKFIDCDIYAGEDIPSFEGYVPGMPLFMRNAHPGGRRNGLAWTGRPYDIQLIQAQKAIELINVSVEIQALSDVAPAQVVVTTSSGPYTASIPIVAATRITESSKQGSATEIQSNLPTDQEGIPYSEPVTLPPLAEELPPPPASPVDETEREQLTKARVGQGVYRKRLEEIERCCRLTGLSDMAHLRASHIKPWRECNDAEKLDGNNGLLMSPHVDHLFDRGYISFSDAGDLLVSNTLGTSVLAKWRIDGKTNVGGFNPRQRLYLAYHRAKIFKK